MAKIILEAGDRVYVEREVLTSFPLADGTPRMEPILRRWYATYEGTVARHPSQAIVRWDEAGLGRADRADLKLVTPIQ